MARFIGAVLGAAHAGTSSQTTRPAYANGRVARIARDLWTGDAAQNDDVVLADVDWNTVFDEHSFINFTDFGTGVNLDVGVAVGPSGADIDCLVDGQDISTAAGKVELLKSVAIGDRHKPLWQLAGFTSYEAAKSATRANDGRAKLIATFKDGDPASGTLAWTIFGSPQ
jgi:hypothetical protein